MWLSLAVVMHSKHDDVQIMPQNILISHPHMILYTGLSRCLRLPWRVLTQVSDEGNSKAVPTVWNSSFCTCFIWTGNPDEANPETDPWWPRNSVHCDQDIYCVVFLFAMAIWTKQIQKECPLWPGHTLCSVPFLSGIWTKQIQKLWPGHAALCMF